ncbi:MAG: ATP-binding protein [Candidatus Schekmanbacteria bacterium]|nr:ATP-binding protein [Candidatus Schekmanbacteria bacterium]
MKQRKFWKEKIEKAWNERSVIWLSGVRRAGKTFLCQSLPDTEYFDCELPSVRRMMSDPESFLDSFRKKRVIIDEIHRLGNPSELLKIAADHYKDIRLIATGSSTLGASAKFRDTLAGRKTELWLTPMTISDTNDFENPDITHRFLRGGMPPFFMSSQIPEKDFQEWMDAYWAKDIQELFRLERRYSFQKFAELLMMQSGGIFEATRFTRLCEVSRSTISNYLKALEATYVVHIIRPFNTRKTSEIISAPKVYTFDTGFICYYRGWHNLRPDDMGFLWEHLVLNELHAHLQSHNINYWRDKKGHEVDFILVRRGKPPLAIECKWSADDFDASNLQSFFRQYPKAEGLVVANDVKRSFSKKYGNVSVKFLNLQELLTHI